MSTPPAVSASALSAPGQLLQRYGLDSLHEHQVLVINSSDAAGAALPQVCSWNLHFGYHQLWQASGKQSHFTASAPDYAATAAIIYVPKEKPLLAMLLAAVAKLLPVGAPVWLVGEKRSGIKSVAKQLSNAFTGAQKLTDGNHCSLFATEVVAQAPAWSLDDYASWVQYQHPLTDTLLELCTFPGVFAHESVDSGSHYLLRHLPVPRASSRVLDFACGAGVLGACLQQQQPQLQVTYVDVSALALAATEATLTRNKLATDGDSTTVMAADKLDTKLGKFDFIVSHPPFHTGVATDYRIGQQFLRQAREHLTAQGELWLVANKFLPWPELIEQSFGHCERIANDNRYAVYRAQARAPARSKGRRKA